MKYLTMTVSGVLILAALLACKLPGSSEEKGESEGASASGGGDKIGVTECDEYLTKWESCYKDAPAAARDAAAEGKKKMVEAWKKAAETEAGKAGLAQGCKSALDSLKSNPMCK